MQRHTQGSELPVHVVIAGGGVAAVELALALHDLAGARVRLTLVAPEPDFHLRPLATAEPFSVDHVRHISLRDLARRVDANLITDAVSAVDAGARRLRLAGGGSVEYDTLVLAIGAHHEVAFTRALTFTGDVSTLPFNGLLADIEGAYTDSVAFVVPSGTTWTLPIYELALMTARAAYDAGMDDMRLQVVTPEPTPLALFGPDASAAVAELLETAGVAFRGSTAVSPDRDGRLLLEPGGPRLKSDRVVALPRIVGPHLAGLPSDAEGFIPIDDHGRVRGVNDVYAAGDATTFPIKQGGIACQLADAIAEQLAAAAGAAVDPQPFVPLLRGRLLAGHGAAYLKRSPPADARPATAPPLHLWSAAHKIDGRYLSPWLEELGAGAPEEPAPEGPHLDVAVPLPSAHEPAQDAARRHPDTPAALG